MRAAAVLVFVELFACAPLAAATLSAGQSAYSQNRVAEAEQIFAGLLAETSTDASDRSSAARQLARIAWLIDGDADRALGHLEAATRTGDKPCDTAALTARVLKESRRSADLVKRGPALLQSCPEPSRDDEILTHIVGARLDLAAGAARDRAALLAAAAEDARNFGPDADVESARVRLEVALMRDDAASALAAWKDYFWVDEGDAPQALAKSNVSQTFAQALRRNASVDDRLKLTDLLMRTGFAIQSRRFADAHRLQALASGSPTTRRLQAYWAAREAVESAFLKANRQMARGGKVPAVLKAVATDLDKIVGESAKSLLAAAEPKANMKETFKANYGMVGSGRGETSGYPSLHMGHLIEDREMLIQQHGKTAKIHYMSVDNMLANGFESWLWDGGPMVGGWQADGVIVNVRPGYVKSPLRSYRQSQDTAERRELTSRAGGLAKEDLAQLKSRPVATLAGLSDRLQLQLVDRIMAVARSKGGDEAAIRKAFLAEFSRANFNQSIEIHEGRHAIDETLGLHGKVEQAVLEYQAKLSELVLANYPRMALRNMNHNLEGSGPHDRAGAKVFDEFRKWIEAHPSDVMDYDPSVPALAQLDKLTDSQIREIARKIDPLPNDRPSPPKLGN